MPTTSSLKRCALTGASGFLGRTLVNQFLNQGWSLKVLVLPQENIPPHLVHPQIECHLGNICDLNSLDGFLTDCDTVIHLAGLILSNNKSQLDLVNTVGLQNLVVALQNQAPQAHLIATSSISVQYPKLTHYGQSKQNAESLLHNSSLKLHWTIVRPSLLIDEYGGAEWNHFVKYVKKWPFTCLIQGGRVQKNPIHTLDLAQAFVLIAMHSKQAQHKVYTLCGGESCSLAQMAKWIRQANHHKLRILSLPHTPISWFCSLVDYLFPQSFFLSQALAGFVYPANEPIPSDLLSWGFEPQKAKNFIPQILLHSKANA